MKISREASGFQIAFFTLAVNFISIPIGKKLAVWCDCIGYESTISRALILLFGLAAVASFPTLRHRAREYLGRTIRPERRIELVAVIAVDVSVISFAIAGGLTAWNWFSHGPAALQRVQAPSALLASAVSPAGLTFTFLAVFVAPLIEEIVFRGFLLDAWRKRFGWSVSAALTSAVFAVYHTFFMVAFIQSLIFISVLRRTGSLRAVIVLHACANLSLWYPLLGQFVFPSNPQGNVWIWSPHFLCVALAVCLVPWYVWLAWSRPSEASSCIPLENAIRS